MFNPLDSTRRASLAILAGLVFLSTVPLHAGPASRKLDRPLRARAERPEGETQVIVRLKRNADGRSVSLSDFAGKTLVLEWNNPDCPTVKEHYDGGIIGVSPARSGSRIRDGEPDGNGCGDPNLLVARRLVGSAPRYSPPDLKQKAPPKRGFHRLRARHLGAISS